MRLDVAHRAARSALESRVGLMSWFTGLLERRAFAVAYDRLSRIDGYLAAINAAGLKDDFLSASDLRDTCAHELENLGALAKLRGLDDRDREDLARVSHVLIGLRRHLHAAVR
jgi:hypothetical protein